MTTRLLVWTENYWVGGSDRFLADLLPGLDAFGVRMAGNRHAVFDAWLAERAPEALPRTTIRVANLVDSPLARLRSRLAPPVPATAGEADGRPSVSPVEVASAALRYRAAAVNYVRLRRLLRRMRPDAILLNNGGYPGAESCRALTLAAGDEGVERVVHFVHNMAYPPWWPQAPERTYDRRVDAATTVWVTAAHRASDALAEARGIPRERIETVHYGIPAPPPAPARFDRDQVRASLGFGPRDVGLAVVAAFEPRKGHRLLLEALRATPDHVRLAVVGRGPVDVPAIARELGVADRVRFLGWRDDVDEILRASDALALASLGNECLPYAILEAMAHGLPIVATDVAGIPEEVEDGVTGRVVPAGDSVALASAITDVAGAPGRRRALGEAGLRRQRELFARDRMVSRMAELLRV